MYDFDKLVNRKDIGSMKWDCKDNELPMWVADMDIASPDFVIEEMVNRAKLGTYGYSIVPEEWYQAYRGWWLNRYGVDFNTEWMVYSTGVVASISSAVKKLTTPAESVLIQSPVYNCFYSSIGNAGRNILSSDLVYENGVYKVDWEDLEKKLANPQTTLMILCNPHNPIGKTWTRDELEKIGFLCAKYGVTVISDEIHCDLTRPGMKYIPFASINETNKNISITCLATGKTFNLAGLHAACNVIPNPQLRHKFWRGVNTDECGEPNHFSIYPNIVALTKGSDWADELRVYIQKNKDYFKDTIESALPNIHVVPSDATYLLWVDVSKYTKNADELAEYIRAKTGLWINGGNEYGHNGMTFIRVNCGTQFSRVKEGAARLIAALKDL